MAMANGGYRGYGGYGGYGGPAVGYDQDQGHSSSSNGGGGGGEHEQDDGEEFRRLQARMKEVDLECHHHSEAANQIQNLLEERAVARLETEERVKRMKQEHEMAMQEYKEKSREINEKLAIKDKQVKELTIRNKRTKDEVDTALKRRKELVDKIKREEREAIEAEERRREEQRHASAAGSGGGGFGGQKEKDAIASPNGAGMGRRTQSIEASSHSRRASTGGRVGPAVAGQRQEKGPSSVQPRRLEQIRQSRVEYTLNDFFGL